MATLITGGAGYIGSHMVHELANRGRLLDGRFAPPQADVREMSLRP
jgi:nucleoside-diphosphate-sugar epimerase